MEEEIDELRQEEEPQGRERRRRPIDGAKCLCAAAAAYGQLACLHYLHDEATQVAHGRKYTCEEAHENGCDWDEWTCRMAAMLRARAGLCLGRIHVLGRCRARSFELPRLPLSPWMYRMNRGTASAWTGLCAGISLSWQSHPART